jgi:hypothetical protein
VPSSNLRLSIKWLALDINSTRQSQPLAAHWQLLDSFEVREIIAVISDLSRDYEYINNYDGMNYNDLTDLVS